METELLKIGAAYVRVSDERQDEYSPDSQLKKVREYAEKEGYIIPDEYVFYDDGISGKSTKRREDFNRMIAIAKEKNHPFDVIYVWKFSRFARNQEQSILYKNLLQKSGVSVKSVSEPLPEGHFSSLIERIIEWMDEFYLINLRGEVTRGMTERVSRGEPVIPAPFGYKNAGKTYIPDEESGSAEIVREIFERYANGEGQRMIAVALGRRGVRTKRGNPPDNRWVEYILWNPCYIGKQRWSPDGERAVCDRKFDSEKIQIWDGNWQPLVSQELWDKVHERLDVQKKTYAKYAKKQQPIDYMLKGLVRCSACGGTLSLASKLSGKSKVRTLQCCYYATGKCRTSHSITITRVNTNFLQGLQEAVEEKNFNMVPTQKPRKETPEIDYDKLIAVEERRLARAKEAYLNEIDTLEQYKQNKETITARIEELKAMRDMEEVQEVDIDAFAEKVSSVLELCKSTDTSESAKNEALRTIIEKVVYEKAKGNLAIYFHQI